MLGIRYFPEDRDLFGNPDRFREMFSSSGDWYTGEDDDPYALFIVIRTDCPEDEPIYEEDALKCSLEGLLALFSLYGRDEAVTGRLEAWCGSRIRKVVKRAHGSKWRKLVSMMEQSQETSVIVEDLEGACSVAVFTPMRFSEQPKVLKNLQVSGLDLPSDGIAREPSDGGLHVILDEDVALTTGKAVAQAGHALQLALRNLSDADYRRWKDELGYAMSAERGRIEPGVSYPVEVTDAGFTEVVPGTRTAVALVKP